MNTTSHGSSGRAASSPSGPFQRNKDQRRIDALVVWASRLIVAHTIMLSALPYVAAAGSLTDGWSSETGLLILFLLGPLASFALFSYGSQRIGSILFLSVMPASAFTHVQFLTPWFIGGPTSALDAFPLLYVSLLVLLTLTDLAASYVAFSILRAVHEMPADETSA